MFEGRLCDIFFSDSSALVWLHKGKFLNCLCFEVTVFWKEILCSLEKMALSEEKAAQLLTCFLLMHLVRSTCLTVISLSLNRDASFLLFFCCGCVCYLLWSPKVISVKMGDTVCD